MFKRYECGCVGFVIEETRPKAKIIWLVKPCDTHHDDPEYCLTHSPGRSTSLACKPSDKLDGHEVAEVLHDLGQLVADGYRFREIQRLLSS